MARPTSLTPEVSLAVVESVRGGATIAMAAAAAGVTPSSVYEWQARGRRGDDGFVEFSEALTRARGVAAVAVMGSMYRAAVDGDVKAAALWLDRTGHAGADEPLVHPGEGRTLPSVDRSAMAVALALLDEASPVAATNGNGRNGNGRNGNGNGNGHH